MIGSVLSIFYGFGFVGNIIIPILLSSIAVAADWRSAYYLLAFLFLLTLYRGFNFLLISHLFLLSMTARARQTILN